MFYYAVYSDYETISFMVTFQQSDERIQDHCDTVPIANARPGNESDMLFSVTSSCTTISINGENNYLYCSINLLQYITMKSQFPRAKTDGYVSPVT